MRVFSRFSRFATWNVIGSAALCSTVLLSARTSFAWVYPEHRDITLLALHKLDPEKRRLFDSLWAAARSKHEARLCAVPDDAAQGEHPPCIDYAAWPAIAGDHSCSSEDMVKNIMTGDWILDVADATARLKKRLAEAKGRNARVNATRDSDIDLQRADPEYATRASSNQVHFLLPRPGVGTTLAAYATAAVTEGAGINALAGYAWFHLDALEKARLLTKSSLTEDQRAELSLAILADEAFAVHFLEDVFAAGHITGSRGASALRKGTHDYYNEHGIEITTWNNDHAILTGDAWMRPEDAERAAEPVRRSIEQVLDALAGVGEAASIEVPQTPSMAPGTLDVCRTATVPRRKSNARVLLNDIVKDTPVPMLASGLGEMPRFRTELGPFIGVQSAARGASLNGGFGKSQNNVGAVGGLELGFRMGVGLDGVMNESGDGLVFLDFGIRLDGESTNSVGTIPSLPEAGGVSAVIPARFGYALRLRLPFWLLPLDTLVATPILLLVSPSALTSMAVAAGNGGLIPWQSGIATPVGRFQFILGREIGFGIFGYGRKRDRFVVPSAEGSRANYTLVGLSSIQLDFPLLEYRPFRSFSLDQSSSLVIQLYGGVDIPTRTLVLSPVDTPEPELKAVWNVGLRLAFDWRNYL